MTVVKTLSQSIFVGYTSLHLEWFPPHYFPTIEWHISGCPKHHLLYRQHSCYGIKPQLTFYNLDEVLIHLTKKGTTINCGMCNF